VPCYETEGAAGMDLRAFLASPITLQPGERALIPTGLRVAIPKGYEGQIRPRSGLALTHGLTVLNAPGTIDADYRGEIKVILINLGYEAATIEPGQRIAQLVIVPVARADLVPVAVLPETGRGEGGFGHTGAK
jgi:dUTP pyrophosphatase